jgi:hypothetical protein
VALTRDPKTGRSSRSARDAKSAREPARDVTSARDDAPVRNPNVPAPATGREIVQPIVVPNTLWQSSNPLAYDGGRPSEITHLADVERSGTGARDNAR